VLNLIYKFRFQEICPTGAWTGLITAIGMGCFHKNLNIINMGKKILRIIVISLLATASIILIINNFNSFLTDTHRKFFTTSALFLSMILIFLFNKNEKNKF
jgi:hypothetical protein